MFTLVLEACPSFQAQWEEFLAEWKEERELPQYLALTELARHLIAKLEQGLTDDFPAIFDVVEKWHTEGDPYVREAASLGLLEDLQNLNLHQGTKPEEFIPFLQPESLLWWRKVEDFWAKGKLLTDD